MKKKKINAENIQEVVRLLLEVLSGKSFAVFLLSKEQANLVCSLSPSHRLVTGENGKTIDVIFFEEEKIFAEIHITTSHGLFALKVFRGDSAHNPVIDFDKESIMFSQLDLQEKEIVFGFAPEKMPLN